MRVVEVATRSWNKANGGNNLSLKGLTGTIRGLGKPMRREIELIKEANEAATKGTKGTKGLDKALSQLPAKVITKMAQPGMVTSKKDVDQLREKYDLTPKQVKTIVKALGIGKAEGEVEKFQGALANI